MSITLAEIVSTSQNEYYNIQIVMILAVGLALATLLGYFSQKAKLSPIFGYLVAGYMIGPYSPGFVADAHIAEQLAEIGVILMMFGVGLHLKWQELVNVRNIAIPGAIIQTLLTTIAGAWLVHSYGWPLETGLVIGLAIGVASTVVMIRVLSDNNMVSTPEGHIAIGWLIVEDILTVIALLLLPALAASVQGEGVSVSHVAHAVGIAVLKCILLIATMLIAGFKIVSWIFLKVARTRSQELFTLTVLSLIFVIATGSALLFGTSIALGAFMAGLVIGQTEVRHQASANALPLKDTFAVIFFLSVGMLFNPVALISNFPLFIGIMVIILLIKPLIAYIVAVALGRSFQTALLVAFSLAQIGEFSFIVSEEALKLKLLPDDGFDIIVACALVSIALNPLIFSACRSIGKRWDKASKAKIHAGIDQQLSISKQAIIVGFGPIGQDVAKILEELGIVPVIIETNVDTINTQKNNYKNVIYGDATVKQILEAAKIDTANILIITTPEINTTLQIIELARELNDKIYIIARAIYRSDKKLLADLKVSAICDEEESRHAFIDTIRNLSTA